MANGFIISIGIILLWEQDRKWDRTPKS